MGRPLFFEQIRIGRDGEPFGILKFRSMRDATPQELELAAQTAQNGNGPGGVEGVDRRTRVGTILRKTSIDELPQLLNVLSGSMSLVGPRPWPQAEVARHSAEGFDYRNQIVAGWTGPSQVQKGGPETGPWFDLQYVEACRTWGPLRLLRYDLRVIAATLGVMARRGGLDD